MRFVSSNASPTIFVTFGLPAIQPTFTPLATSRVFCPTPSQAEIFHTESKRFFPEELFLLSCQNRDRSEHSPLPPAVSSQLRPGRSRRSDPVSIEVRPGRQRAPARPTMETGSAGSAAADRSRQTADCPCQVL